MANPNVGMGKGPVGLRTLLRLSARLRRAVLWLKLGDKASPDALRVQVRYVQENGYTTADLAAQAPSERRELKGFFNLGLGFSV